MIEALIFDYGSKKTYIRSALQFQKVYIYTNTDTDADSMSDGDRS